MRYCVSIELTDIKFDFEISVQCRIVQCGEGGRDWIAFLDKIQNSKFIFKIKFIPSSSNVAPLAHVKGIFVDTISFNIFSFMDGLTEFDDKSTWEERWENYKYAWIKPMLHTRTSNLYSAIDEILYPYRAAIGFK